MENRIVYDPLRHGYHEQLIDRYGYVVKERFVPDTLSSVGWPEIPAPKLVDPIIEARKKEQQLLLLLED